MTWAYRCPDCGTDVGVHAPDCAHSEEEFAEVQRTYIDVVSALAARGAAARGGVAFRELTSAVGAMEGTSWRSLHTDVLHELKRHRFVDEYDGLLHLREPGDRAGELVPTYEPVRTVYEHGPVDGCKDHAVYTMVSWCEMHDLDWEQTCAFVRRWLEETDAWEEQSWGEGSISELLENKRHVHREGLGWKESAEAAKHVIEDAAPEQKIDADERAGTIDAEELTQ